MVGKFSISRLNEKKTNGKIVDLVFADTKAIHGSLASIRKN